ncbi:hypothetical protein VTN00DRAFT_6825 [Thermoascus crustaceus]|uniref:uncharacterized protein n=1 Tax=Thermoascus crustaceus TaxID=5088 RepID=UPI00374364F3
MSALQRSPQVGLLDYDHTRVLHDSVPYPPYAQSPYVTQLFPSSLEDHVSHDPESLHYVTNQDFTGSVAFEESRSPALGTRARQVPEVTSYSPQRGSEGTKVLVYIRSPYDLHSTPCMTFSLSFGSKKCECIPQLLSFQDSVFQYVLSVVTPPFSSTGSPSFAVPLQVVMDSQTGYGTTILQVGVYTYEHASQPSPSDESRKRRVSCVSDNSLPRPKKRPSDQQLQIKEDSETYSFNDNCSSASYSPFLQTSAAVNIYPAQYAPASSPNMTFSHHSRGSSAPQASIKAPSPLQRSWSPSFATVSHASRSPGLPVTPAPHQQAISSPARPPNPTLIRTSTIQQNNLSQTQPFNPYAMYPSKAVLKLNGDLDSMAEKWTAEEREAKRRLVQFTRVQTGSTIHADFKPVTPEDRAPNSICISCIYWDGKKECFVTSVDTIYLLESLVGVRFTVEEKNRIRRNLEGFRPLTVSKAKAESEEFFKVIMGFPAPKPRNIEKDVKVFPWKILAHALKKIIGKYSASYSSTAGALPTPIGSNYGTASDAGTDPQHSASPQSVSDSVTSSTYGAGLTSTTFSPQVVHSKPSLPGCVSGPPELRVTMPAASHPYASTSMYSYVPTSQQNLTAPVSRGSWDFTGLVNTTPGVATPSNSEGFNYMASVPYSIGHSTPGA